MFPTTSPQEIANRMTSDRDILGWAELSAAPSLGLAFGLAKLMSRLDLRTPRSLHRIVVFLHPAARLQYFPSLRTVRWAGDSVLLHQVNEPRSAAVADAQTSLQRRSRGPAHFTDHPHGILVQVIVNFLTAIGSGSARSILILGRLQQILVECRVGLILPEIAHRLHFAFVHVWPVNAMQARRTCRQVEHVALAQQ